MQYYKYLNNVVRSDSLMKGRAYPPYLIEHVDTYEESKQFVHLFYVESSSSLKTYEVIIKNDGDDIFDGTCTCPQYERAGTCKHVAACLIYFRNCIISAKKVDVLKQSKDILDLFYNPTTNLNIKEKLNIKLNLDFYNNEIHFKLYLGTAKLYVLNTKSKFESFIESYTHGGDNPLGAKLTYNKDKYYFDDSDAKLINYLTNYERNYYHNSDIFLLNERDLEYIFNNITPDKLTIMSEPVLKITTGLPTSFYLQKNKDKYELTIKDLENYKALTPSFQYIFYKNILYIPSFDERHILSELDNRMISTIAFQKKDFEKFSKGLLKNIKNNLEISEDIDINLNTKPDAKIYFDLGTKLKAKITLNYSGKELEIFANESNVIRDYAYEEEILQDLINSGFTIQNNKLIMDDIDKIGHFYEFELPRLTAKYEIYTNKKFSSVNLIKKSNITKNFSIGTSGIMSFNFNIDNIDMNELKDIFNALEAKKTYHKLKNGNIINLEEDEEIQNLNNLLTDLELDSNNLSDSITIPKYRALYIDSLREIKYNDIETNSIFDEFITNFKAYKDVKIKFSKEDAKILRDYQKIGVRWLYTLYKCDLGGILADEMGLGKSIQTICFIKEVLKEKNNAKILVVCPTSLVYNWQKEFSKFGPELKYTTISDVKTKRSEILKQDFNIFITSYGLLRNDLKEYQEKEFELCIIDEAQYIKNYQAKMTIALKSLNAKTKIALTGTPLENSVTELWSIFDFLMPGYLNSVKKFHEKYHISDVKQEDLDKLKNLNYQIRPFILRRKKNEVSKELPDKLENNIYLELPEEQKKLYLSVLKETEKEIEELIARDGFKKARFKILILLTKLRQICIDPHVLYDNYQGEAIKVEKLIEIIKNYVKEKHKILIFSSFKRILDLLKVRLTKEDISFYSIDGGVKSKARVKLVDDFNNDDTSCFLITLKSGGTGLNLTSADIVIHLDIWWNPQVENQATDRAHRIGQTKKVIVNKIITKGTIEERILELQNKKKILSENLIEGDTSTEMISSLTENELKDLLKFNQE